ncbi:MAG: DnaD domain protein, partial [Candidatus Onthovivens sp.]|nr:DnaD domain protein [Candidatus Onthovivens sp.]
EQSIFSEEELKRNEESVKLREEVFSLLEEVFSRSLSPIEISRADEWIKANVDRDIIINSIKDAKVRNELSINAIDRIIINKIRSLNN